MGKQGSPRSPRPKSVNSAGMKEYEGRCPETLLGSDPSLGRRISGGDSNWNRNLLLHGLKNEPAKFGACKGVYMGKKHTWFRKHVRSVVFMFGLMSFLFLLDSLMVSIFDSMNLQSSSTPSKPSGLKEDRSYANEEKSPVLMYDRLLNLASSALAEKEFKQDSLNFWEEPCPHASVWKPCADRKSSKTIGSEKSNGFILVSANGGLNQQRVAICNAVAVASLLNATLVLPKFLYSNVWKDPSQFGDIYQEEYFINIMKDEIEIVKELPPHLESLDMEAIGSLITDADIPKEAKPIEYVKKVLPLLLRNGVVHFLGFGNRLGFDPLPFKLQSMKQLLLIHQQLPPTFTPTEVAYSPNAFNQSIMSLWAVDPDYLLVQDGGSTLMHSIKSSLVKAFSLRLRCKCNFHALKFVPKIQQVGSLLVRRIRKYDAAQSMLDKQLLGSFVPNIPLKENRAEGGPSKYLALHLRFEADMVAYSLCEFGGGENEQKELQAYREIHFPLLIERLKNMKPVSPTKWRKLGKCPLTPEEAALVLSGLGFKRGTYIYLAGSHIYGGQSRMHPFTNLYPNLVTKEDLLSPSELEPFRNFSSQLAALDFIACATADVFAMTDSGSQLSSLVSGFRTYYGGGRAPTLRPNKKRLAAILLESRTIGWNSFEERVKKMIEEGQRVRVRGFGRSIYRQPRCPQCMCKSHLH